jgi:hypothetical protein
MRSVPCPTYASPTRKASGKSRHLRSDVIDTDTDTSPYPFSFSPVFLFLEYRRVNSHLNLVPQDHHSRTTRTSALTAIGLLLVSSSISLSIPFAVGKLIDYYFTSSNPVGLYVLLPSNATESGLIGFSIPQTIPYGVSLTQATAGLFLVFTIGGVCNAGRAFLMRMSSAGASWFSLPQNTYLIYPHRSANCPSPSRTNICCDSSPRSRIRGARGG